VLKKIENRMAEVVKKEIEAVLYRCQEELNTDIFGFGATFNRSFPREWEELKGDWEIEFPRLEISLEVAAHVKHSGLTMKSIKKAK
jgi:spore germination protein KC